MPEIVSEVTSRGASGGSGAAARPIISQSVAVGGAISSLPSARARGESGGGAEREAPANGGTIHNEVHVGGPRVLSESARKLLEVLDKPADDKPAAAAGQEAAPAAATQPASAPLGAPLAQPAAAPAAAPAQPAAAPHAAELERALTRSRELLEENTRLKQGGARREPSPREKALDEIDRTYLDNPRAAVRRLAALALGHEDPNHADVTAEIKGLFQDLTAEELGVSVDASQQAIREAARTRHMLARDQRERKADAAAASPAPESAEDKQTAADTQVIGNLISSQKVDGKSFADRYPFTAAMSEEVHGVTPESLLLKVIYNGFATGEYDRKTDADKLVEAAAKKAEDLYKALDDKFAKARPQPSTAQPTPAPEIANKEGQGQAARSITNASASVAPATPPAKADTTQPPKKYRTLEEKRNAIIARHTGGS